MRDVKLARWVTSRRCSKYLLRSAKQQKDVCAHWETLTEWWHARRRRRGDKRMESIDEEY